MNPPIKTEKTSRKYISVHDDDKSTAAFAEFDPHTKRHTITIPYRASTKMRLHEIAHCELGHCINQVGVTRISIDQYMEQEIDAEEWAFSKCGKLLTLDAVLHYAFFLIIDLGRGVCPVFSACIKAMAKHGYHLDKEHQSILWWKCREFEKERKREA